MISICTVPVVALELMSIKEKLPTLRESGLFDAANASISFNELNGLNGLRDKLGNEVVGVEDQSLEYIS